MLTLGIVNTYDKIKLHEAHYRSIARAAPVAYAFGFNLALFDYPFKMNAEELMNFVKDKTLSELIKKKKSYLFLIGLGHKGLPAELFERAQYHLDITGMGVSFETCTAIGAVPAVIAGWTGKEKR